MNGCIKSNKNSPAYEYRRLLPAWRESAPAITLRVVKTEKTEQFSSLKMPRDRRNLRLVTSPPNNKIGHFDRRAAERAPRLIHAPKL